MDSENFGLLTCEQFRRIRDETALDDMLKRGRALKPKLTAAWKEVQRLRRWRGVIEQFEVAGGYNLTREQFQRRMRVVNMLEKLDGKLKDQFKEWADIETEISTIARDPRYVAWKAGKELKQIEVVATDMMQAMGLKRASGE